eukprot:jgi/Picre1/34233/NNA_001707.t1
MVQQQYNLVVLFIAVLLFCYMGGFAHEGVSHEEDYFAACVTYLEAAKDSLESGGVSRLVSDGYKTYLEYPSGPYVFCFSQSAFSVDTIGQSALVLHPFTANKTLDDLLDTCKEESLSLQDRKAELISNALSNNRTLGELFNYTEPYSQEKSDAGGIRVDGEEKNWLGLLTGWEMVLWCSVDVGTLEFQMESEIIEMQSRVKEELYHQGAVRHLYILLLDSSFFSGFLSDCIVLYLFYIQ